MQEHHSSRTSPGFGPSSPSPRAVPSPSPTSGAAKENAADRDYPNSAEHTEHAMRHPEEGSGVCRSKARYDAHNALERDMMHLKALQSELSKITNLKAARVSALINSPQGSEPSVGSLTPTTLREGSFSPNTGEMLFNPLQELSNLVPQLTERAMTCLRLFSKGAVQASAETSSKGLRTWEALYTANPSQSLISLSGDASGSEVHLTVRVLAFLELVSEAEGGYVPPRLAVLAARVLQRQKDPAAAAQLLQSTIRHFLKSVYLLGHQRVRKEAEAATAAAAREEDVLSPRDVTEFTGSVPQLTYDGDGDEDDGATCAVSETYQRAEEAARLAREAAAALIVKEGKEAVQRGILCGLHHPAALEALSEVIYQWEKGGEAPTQATQRWGPDAEESMATLREEFTTLFSLEMACAIEAKRPSLLSIVCPEHPRPQDEATGNDLVDVPLAAQQQLLQRLVPPRTLASLYTTETQLQAEWVSRSQRAEEATQQRERREKLRAALTTEQRNGPAASENTANASTNATSTPSEGGRNMFQRVKDLMQLSKLQQQERKEHTAALSMGDRLPLKLGAAVVALLGLLGLLLQYGPSVWRAASSLLVRGAPPPRLLTSI